MTLLHPPAVTHVDVGIEPRGPLSRLLLQILAETPHEDALELAYVTADASTAADPIFDDDIQLSLFLLYASAYGSLAWIDAGWEWNTELIAVRRCLERVFEASVREHARVSEHPEPTRDAVASALFDLTSPRPGPSLSRFVARHATLEQARELLVQRSIYTLREADAHSWTIPG